MSTSRRSPGNRTLGIVRRFHYDHTDDSFKIEKTQDVARILEANKIANNMAPERWGYHDGLHRVASIPILLWFELEKKGITKDPALLRKFLNDPDNRKLRTRPGRV